MGIETASTLVRLRISMLGAKKKDEAVSEVAKSNMNATSESGYFLKAYLPKEAYSLYSQTASVARKFHEESTLPWGDNAERLLPTKKFSHYSERMGGLKEEFFMKVAEFAELYPTFIDKAKRELGDMFNLEDYPGQDKITDYFDFRFTFKPVPIAGDFRIQIAESDKEKIKEQLYEENRRSTQAAMQDLWKRLYKPIDHMAKKLADQDAVFKKSLVDNLVELTQILPDLNVTEDPELIKLCNLAQSELCGYTPTELRKNPAARAETAQAAAYIAEKMKSFMGVSAN